MGQKLIVASFFIRMAQKGLCRTTRAFENINQILGGAKRRSINMPQFANLIQNNLTKSFSVKCITA